MTERVCHKFVETNMKRVYDEFGIIHLLKIKKVNIPMSSVLQNKISQLK